MQRIHRKRYSALKPGGFLLLIAIAALSLALSLGESTDEKVSTMTDVIALEMVIATPPATTTPSATPVPEPLPVERYTEVTIADGELRDLAEIIYHEARGESFEGQQAVAEVVLNRVIADNFPDTVHDVLHQGAGTSKQQFTTIRLLGSADPRKEQYDAINAALYGPTILPADVVFFSRKGENDRVWGTIGGHVFCYQYIWE